MFYTDNKECPQSLPSHMLNLCYEQQCYCQSFKIKFVENQGTWEKCKTQTK